MYTWSARVEQFDSQSDCESFRDLLDQKGHYAHHVVLSIGPRKISLLEAVLHASGKCEGGHWYLTGPMGRCGDN